MLHAKEFGGMPSITETQERRQQRHAELTSGISTKYKAIDIKYALNLWIFNF